MAGLNSVMVWVKTKLSNLFVKAILNADITIINSGGLPTVNVDMMHEETQNDMVYPQQYGIYSAPLKGSQAFIAFQNGSRDEGIVISVADDRYFHISSDFKPGDIMIKYKDTHTIHLSESGVKIEAVSNQPINLEAQNVNVTLSAGGQFAVNNTNFTVDA